MTKPIKQKSVSVHPMTLHDWPRVSEIYSQGIATGVATFEIECPDRETWDKNHLKICRLVICQNLEVAGWACLSSVSPRVVYRGVAEVSIYIDTLYRGCGLGEILLNSLVESSELAGFWTLQAVIFSKNQPSIKLHEKLGFRLVGRRERIAKRDGIWHDTLLFERRSKAVG